MCLPAARIVCLLIPLYDVYSTKLVLLSPIFNVKKTTPYLCRVPSWRPLPGQLCTNRCQYDYRIPLTRGCIWHFLILNTLVPGSPEEDSHPLLGEKKKKKGIAFLHTYTLYYSLHTEENTSAKSMCSPVSPSLSQDFGGITVGLQIPPHLFPALCIHPHTVYTLIHNIIPNGLSKALMGRLTLLALNGSSAIQRLNCSCKQSALIM